MSAQVSVIIPFYNTARYIGRCCESLFGQTLSSMEYVFVDDASTDESVERIREVLERYTHRKDQVKILRHEVHQGVGAARHHGLDASTGDFVIHCDSDDWVELSMYEHLYNKAKQLHADIVVSGYTVESFDGQEKSHVRALSFDTDAIPFSIGPQVGSLCNKLVRREFILVHHMQIPLDINWGEDLCFSIRALILSDIIVSDDSPLYHYVQQKDSLTHDINPTLCQDLLKCGTFLEIFLLENNLLPKYEFQLNWLKFQLKQYLLIFPETRDITAWSRTYPESNHSIRKYSAPFYLKAVSWLIVHRCKPFASLLLSLKDKLSHRIHS